MDRAEMAGVMALAPPHDMAIVEGAMGLFDAGPARGKSGSGATADVAAATGWPVLLVVDAARMAQTVGAIALGCARFDPNIELAGVILNRVASQRHRALAASGLAQAGVALLGAVPTRRQAELASRHLGLVQAQETPDLDSQITTLADAVMAGVDLDQIVAISRPGTLPATPALRLVPPGGRIALARDDAFSFMYPHLIDSWRAAGATILPFSPLADEAPDPSADVVWLPGGYPELHAGRLAAASRFRGGMADFARNKPVHGECGGYMTLGTTLTTPDGTCHAMLGLLGLETSFTHKHLHLGYRRASLRAAMPGYQAGSGLMGHEFHHARVVSQPDQPLAVITDPTGAAVPETGSRRGHVSGSFFHLIAPDNGHSLA
jgi:cobyrinic acid a,c-diamide synthase